MNLNAYGYNEKEIKKKENIEHSKQNSVNLGATSSQINVPKEGGNEFDQGEIENDL